MSPRRIELRSSPDRHRWQASAVVDGSRYIVSGGSAQAVFHEFCRLLHVPAGRWRAVKLASGRLLCEPLPLVSQKPPSTAEIPVVTW